MPTPTLPLPQQWQDIGAEYACNALADSLAELHRLDSDIDYSFQLSMRAVAKDSEATGPFSEFETQAIIRGKLYTARYKILLGLFAGLGERKGRTQEG